MRYGSVCSGIEAATVAWHGLGWQPAFFSEIDPFPCQVLAHHYPTVPNYGDMTQFENWSDHDEPIRVLVGGTPCQSFSIGGLRKGLDDPRGNLMLTYLAIARKYRPKWVAWENVPGVLHSNGGRDFATLLGGLAECGYGFAYRVLDSQFIRTHQHPVAVPQRRRRVFVVGCLGDWRAAAAVLFERESLSGNLEPSRTPWKNTATSTEGSTGASRGYRLTAFGQYADDDTASTVKARDYKDATDIITVHGTQDPDIKVNVAHTLGRNQGQENAIAYNITFCDANGTRQDRRNGGLYVNEADVSNTLTCAGVGTNPITDMKVRRLTPREYERLQGFPDDYTKIADNTPDAPRYKALGNSMAVNCMRWIGERIQLVEDIHNDLQM